MSKIDWVPIWRALQQGDRVDVVAPASGAPVEQVEAGIAVLESWGLKVRVADPLQKPDPFFAHQDSVRWAQLRKALLARDSAAVWCARGGVGCLRLLPNLARLKRPGIAPKPLIGFSDVTVLLTALDAKWGWMPIHGPVLTSLTPGRLARGQATLMRDVLFGECSEVQVNGLTPMNQAARESDGLSGRLLGGNLATLQTLCGTVAQPRGNRRIVFLEDVNERGYEIDRMLTALELTGVFKGAVAVVFGQFEYPNSGQSGKTYCGLALQNFARRMRLPVFKGAHLGHGRHLPPLLIGAPAHIVPSGGRWRLTMPLRHT